MPISAFALWEKSFSARRSEPYVEEYTSLDDPARDPFEDMVSDALLLEESGHYLSALARNKSAYEIAPNLLEAGSLARDISAGSDRLGDSIEARRWAMTAYKIHNGIVRSTDDPTPELIRERAASATRVGVTVLRGAIRAEQSGVPSEDIRPAPLPYLRQALVDQRTVKKAEARTPADTRRVRRGEVDAMRRISIGESVIGDRWSAIVIGILAASVALRVETKKIETFTSSVAALGAAMLTTSEMGRRRNAVLWLADYGL